MANPCDSEPVPRLCPDGSVPDADGNCPRNPSVDPPCPNGLPRNEDGTCPDPSPPPPVPEPQEGRNPFPAPFAGFDASERQFENRAPERLVKDIEYRSAQRYVASILESNFIPEKAIRSVGKLSGRSFTFHPAYFFPFEEFDEVRGHTDLFRQSLYSFNSASEFDEVLNPNATGAENSTSKILHPDRGNMVDQPPAATTSFLVSKRMVFQYNNEGIGDDAFPQPELVNYKISDVPFNVDRINTNDIVERIPFRLRSIGEPNFIENRVVNEEIFGPNTGIPAFADIYMRGNLSPLWNDNNRDQFWQNNQKLRDVYKHGVLPVHLRRGAEFSPVGASSFFHDFSFRAPAAFYRSEMNNILLSPFHSAEITATIGNHNLYDSFGETENERLLPNVYLYYQSAQTKIKIDNNQSYKETLPDDFLDFNTKVLSDYENFVSDQESPRQTPRKLLFPSDRIDLIKQANEVVKGYASNYVEISINTSQGGVLNSLLQKHKMDLPVLDYISNTKEDVDLILEAVNLTNVARDLAPRHGWIMERKFAKVLNDTFNRSQIFLENNPDEEEVEYRLPNDKTVRNIPESIYSDFDHFLDSGFKRYLAERRDLNDYPFYYNGWENKENLKIEELIRSRIFLSKANQIINNGKHQRSYSDILKGIRAYSEVIGYKVEKIKLVKTILLVDH